MKNHVGERQLFRVEHDYRGWRCGNMYESSSEGWERFQLLQTKRKMTKVMYEHEQVAHIEVTE